MKKQFEFRTHASLVGSVLALFLFALTPRNVGAQCTNCPASSTYTGTFSASTTNLSGYHPCLAINGIYDVNVNVTITSSFIYLGPDAQIRIHSGATLTLNNCTVQGCNAMWSRVLVQPGGRLVADDCDIRDGIDGLDARGGAEMTVKNCTFTNNYIGVYLRNKFSTVPPTGITFTEPLSNNIFRTDGGLKPPFAGQMGHAGIKAQNVAPVNIGQVGYPQNQFLNVANGVVSENSLVVVKNALFQAQQACTAGPLLTGISATGGSVSVSSSTFNNCYRAVASSACNLTATGNVLSSACTGFEVANSPGRNVLIKDNVLTNTRLFGINANNNGVFNSFLMEGNGIEMDFAPPGFSPISAVQFSSPSSVTQGNVKIKGNDIEMYGAANGVNVLMNRNTKIQDNTVEITHATGLSPSMEHGIRINACGNSSITGNTAVVVLSTGGASEIHAIELNNSENVLVCGNGTDASDVGFKFNGQNPNTNFSNNTIGSHKVGVFVGSESGGTGAFMGVQGPNNRARDNQWNGAYSQWGAQNENMDFFFINLSRFHVRNTSQPQMPPSINASGWFWPNGTGLNLGCPVDSEAPDDPGEFEKSIALGTLPFTDYATAQHWRAQTTLYRSLRENPSLLGQDGDVDAFYSNAANGTIGIFQAVEEGISSLGVPDGQAAQSYASLEEQVSSKLGELASVDAQLLTASGTAYDGLVAQRHTVSMEIFGLQQSLLALDSSVQAARVARAEQLLALNASASAVTLPQQFLKSVNEVYLNTVGKGVLELTIEQVGLLQPIANTCVHEGGDAVLGARELLKLNGDESEYDDSKLCTPPQLLVQPIQDGHQPAFGEMAVFPNPAMGQVEIRFQDADGERVLQVLSQQGVLMRSVVVAEGQGSQVLSLEGIPTGIYHVTIKGGDHTVSQKLVVLK